MENNICRERRNKIIYIAVTGTGGKNGERKKVKEINCE